MNSYVKLTSRITEGETLLSSQALFPPNKYYIPSSPIISLSSNESICDISQITTDITNKILLTFTSDLCTDYYKTYIAQQKGAIAVIIGLDETVYPITGAENVFNATIPTRGIDKWNLLRLERMLEAANIYPRIEFGCDFKDVPLQLCILDIEGDYWWMDGDYVRQINVTYNDHDIWKREGQYYTSAHNYIFLHNGDTTNDWFWAITTDSTFQDDSAIIAYCNNGNDTVSLPTNCSTWNIRPRWRSRRGQSAYVQYNNLTVSNGSCVYPDNYLCVTSTQSTLGGLSGTYRLFNRNVPFWYKETTQCDETPGIIFWMQWNDNFNIFKSNIWWGVAQCTELNKTIDNYAMYPQRCRQWETIVDNTLDRTERIEDDTFRITDSKCTNEVQCDVSIEPTNSVCVYRNSESKLPSMLGGTYVRTDYIESVEYVKSESVNVNGILYKPYLYYLGGFDEDRERWVLSNVSLSEYNESISLIYGYLECSLLNVVNCQAPWTLLWNNSVRYPDTLLHIDADNCATETATAPIYGNKYDYLCVDIDDITTFITTFDTLDPYQLTGAYEMQRDNEFVYWRKPVNDYTNVEIYMYYDTIFGHWQISTSLTDMQFGIVCMSDALYPDQCDRWYSSDSCRAWSRRSGGCMKSLDGAISFRTDTCSYNDILSKTCSAMHSWLQLSGGIDSTVPSAHALFAPYKYRIQRTEIVLLDDRDNPCVLNGIKNSHITGKMVLLYTKTSYFSSIECSDHQQLFVMQDNNVTAVIMAGNDDTLSVIKDDEYNIDIDSHIPMRGITLTAANEIKKAIQNGNRVYGEFNCNESYRYPLEICANNVGLQVYGNFMLQTKWSDTNGHPIWKRNEYASYDMYSNIYLYLYHGKGNEHWYWAITKDINMENDNDIIAYCNNDQNIENNALIIEPTQCTQWMVYNIDSEWILTDMNMYSEICNVSDNYFCVKSDQSALAGLSGTYRLYYNDEPVWFREWDYCDNAPGILKYDGHGTFLLIDPMDDWKIASCWIGETYEESNEDKLKFRPDLCTEWRSIIDGSLDDTLITDNTMEIKHQIDCSINCTYISYRRRLPNRLCAQKNSIMHSFLEGNFIYTGVRGSKYFTKQYKLNKSLIYDGNSINIYLWYFGELNEQYKWWVISSNNLSIAQETISDVDNGLNSSWILGYATCSVRNIINCNSNWNFYWLKSWHNDPEFTMTRGICTNKNRTAMKYDEMYDYVCIDSINYDIDGDSEYNDVIHMLQGGYKKMNSLSTYVTGNYTPIWKKPPNDFIDMDVYIYYDKFYGYWQIGTNVSISNAILICHNNDVMYPEKCNEWYDLYSKSFHNMIYLRADGCTHKDVLGITPYENDRLAAIVIIFLIVLTLTICSIIVYCIHMRYSGKFDSNVNKNKTEKGRGRKDHQQLADEDSNDDDSDIDEGALNVTSTRSKPTYDFSPLEHTNDNEMHILMTKY